MAIRTSSIRSNGASNEAYPAVPGYSIPPFGPLWVNKAPIGRQIGIAASLATKKVRPASEASKTSAWAIVAVTWDSGISLFYTFRPNEYFGRVCGKILDHSSLVEREM